MALVTPFGALDALDVASEEQQMRILSLDKHQMLEGIVAEGAFRSFLDRLGGLGAALLPLSVVKGADPGGDPVWWVWDRGDKAGEAFRTVARPLRDAGATVARCRYDPGRMDFLMRMAGREPEPVQTCLMRHRGLSEPDFSRLPAATVREPGRSMRAFMGGIQGMFGSPSEVFSQVVLERMFKNFVLSPFFRYLWDVDHLLSLPDGRVMQFEVKHKYPFGARDRLRFGINTGQVRLMHELACAGIETLHMIMVKPVWNDRVSTGYMLNDLAMREHVLILARRIGLGDTEAMLGQQASRSGSKTAFGGRGGLRYVPVPVDGFHLLGTLDDPADVVAGNMLAAASETLEAPVTSGMLQQHRQAEKW